MPQQEVAPGSPLANPGPQDPLTQPGDQLQAVAELLADDVSWDSGPSREDTAHERCGLAHARVKVRSSDVLALRGG
jgi:hypothetical protein